MYRKVLEMLRISWNFIELDGFCIGSMLRSQEHPLKMQVDIEDEIKEEIAEYLKDEAKRLQRPEAIQNSAKNIGNIGRRQ